MYSGAPAISLIWRGVIYSTLEALTGLVFVQIEIKEIGVDKLYKVLQHQ